MTSAFGGQRSIQLSYGCSRRTAGAHHRQAGRRRQWLGAGLPPHPNPLLPREERGRSRCRLRSPFRPSRAVGPDGATAPRAYARSQASGASARRLREMNESGEGQGEVGAFRRERCRRRTRLVGADAPAGLRPCRRRPVRYSAAAARAREGWTMSSMLVTGASRGLGLEMVRQFVDDGWRIYACCRNPDGANALTRWQRLPRARMARSRCTPST